MAGYQIQIQGLLDGATAFVIPTTIPAPVEGGVRKIDAGAGVAAGAFTLGDFVDTDSPMWIRAIHCEFAALTRAARFELTNPGSLAPLRLLPDQVPAVAAAPLMPPWQLWPNCIAQVGSVLTVLTDDTDDTFSGAPVAGPHFLYLDLEAIVDDEQMGLVQDLAAFADAKARAQGETYSSFQAVAATATSVMGSVQSPVADRGTTVMRQMVLEATVVNGDVAAAGESMVITVQQVEVGTGSVRTLAQVTIDDTVAANSVTTIPIVQDNNALVRTGDLIQVTRTYTAGMAPTPMTNTLVRVRTVPQAF